MRKIIISFFLAAFIFGGVSTGYAMNCSEDTLFDKIGDWATTLGKEGKDKDTILAKRKADRMAICAKKQAQQAAKEAKKAGGDMKKKMGF